MTSRAHNRVIVWLLAPLLLAQLSLPTVVLCRGEDGHVALEWSHAGECGPDAQNPGRVEIVDRGHCGECIDTAVSVSDPLSRSQRAASDVTPPAPARVVATAPPITAPKPTAEAHGQAPTPIAFALLGSVVQLI